MTRVRAETVSAAMSTITALATVALVFVASSQLSQIRDDIRIQDQRQKKWATVDACNRYLTDPIIHQATRRVWAASDGGTDYRDHSRFDSHDVATILNFLETLSVGIEQGLYHEDIVHDHFAEVLPKAVRVFIRGESGPTWKATDGFFPEGSVPALIRVYSRWEERRLRYREPVDRQRQD